MSLNIISINIEGDRNHFLSKNAIIRFKTDIKTIKPEDIDVKKYLKEGFNFKFSNKLDITIATIITQTELDEETRKLELKDKLKKLLNENSSKKASESKKKIQSLKRSVPKKIFESYINLMSKYKLENIPAPDDVINNIDKHKINIGVIMGKKTPLSNDPTMSKLIRHYYNTLGTFLNIQPIIINTDPNTNASTLNFNNNNNNNNNTINNNTITLNPDSDDDDEAPPLV